MYKYIKTPKSITISAIKEKGFTLSSSQYMDFVMPNSNFRYVRDFLTRKLKRSDLGIEIGSANYIDRSPCFFLRTKALQSHSFIPDITSETAVPMNPKAFISANLKKGDLLISKDSNIGEIVILDKDYPHFMTSGAIYRLPVNRYKYYLLAFIKHDIFREQLDYMVPKGATIRHAKTMFLDCKIPLPNKNEEETIAFIELLTKAIINKQILIKERHNAILDKIEKELRSNQGDKEFTTDYPSIAEIESVGRFDTNLYQKRFKQIDFLVKNYSKGYQTISDLGFELSRGQNLQVSNIGTSVYSENHYPDFYTLMLPKFLSKYGTVDKVGYLGNSKKLKILKKGDLIIGAEGFEKGRSIVILEDSERTITNIHGITIQQKGEDTTKAIFVKCCLDFFRSKELIDLFAVGGNGGSLAQKYWDIIPFPMFGEHEQHEIARLYHNPDSTFNFGNCRLQDFIRLDDEFNESAGIIELDKSAKMLNSILERAIDDVQKDTPVKISFEK